MAAAAAQVGERGADETLADMVTAAFRDFTDPGDLKATKP
jgi:hypothetical protein